MIKRFLKSTSIFLVILGVTFSNVPFYALSGLIDSYAKTSGIVDKIALLEKSHGNDIVDNFSTLRNISEKLRVMEAMAAVTYNTNSAFVYSALNGTSISPAYPTGVVANDLLVLTIGMKPSVANGGSVTTPAGWTPIISLTGAGGYATTLGADTGNTNVFSFYKVAVGGETGSLAVTIATNNVSWARMHRISNATGSWSVVGATGSDVAAGNVSIAFGTNPGVTAGDLILGAMVIPTDVTTPAQFSVEAFTQTGVTFGAVTEIGEADTTTGNDMGGFIVRVPVSAGTASANPTMTATAAVTNTNVRGPGVFIRIREMNTAPTLTVSQPDGVGDSVQVGTPYNITYDLADPDPKHAVTVAMYYDVDAVGLNGTAITGACATAVEGAGATCSWDTTGMTPGTYYVYGLTSDGIAAQVNDYSPGVITITSPAPTTSISNFVTAEPGNSTIAPGVSGLVDSFGLAVNSGTDTVTGATVTLAAGTGARVATVSITNNGDTVTYCSVAPSGDIATLTGCGIPVTITNTQFKVKVTAISHASMPAVPGAAYAVTGTVTAFTSTNAQSGTDSGSSTLTIDNLSPGNVSATGGSVDNGQVTTSWTNPVDADYHSAVVLRRAGSAVASVPVEGSTYIAGNAIGTATVACVVATPTATCVDSGLVNGTQYHYKIFSKDTNGNYSAGIVPTGSPFTPAAPNTSFVGVAHGDTSALNVTANKPAGTIDGDIMFALVTHRLLEAPNSVPAGWTLAGSNQFTSIAAVAFDTRLYWKVAAAEGASYTWAWATTGRNMVTITTYRGGFDPGNPIDVVSNTLYNVVNTTTRAASMNVTSANSTLLFFGWNHMNPIVGGETFAPPTIPSAWTENVDYWDMVILRFGRTVAKLEWTGSGATGNMDAISSPSTDEKHAFAVALRPMPSITVTGYTNSTETALNYAGACTGCGARIGGGAGFRQTVTIAGTGFGADPGVGNRSSATNNIKIGAQQIASANVTAWSATSITILTDSAVVGDTDTDWGAEFGGASALTVTASGATSAGLNFYVFPQVTSLSTCNSAGFPVGDGAREYDASDSVCPNGLTDGEIFLNGTRFGTASTGGYVQIFGLGATTPSWTNELIRARVPSSALYTGSLVVQQGGGSNNKTHTYTSTNFRIFPRITSFVPTSGSEGGSVTINGNHFCQGAGCPVAFDANNKVVFTSAVQATVFTSWSATSIVTAIPTGAVSGDVVVTSNTYTSNGRVFTVLSNTPTPPTSLNQWKNSGLTQAIAVSGVSSSTPLYLTMIMEVPGISGGTLYPQVEYKAIGTAFTCGAGACVSAVEGNSVAGPGPVDCGIIGNTCAVSIAPTDEVYHWQARVRHNKGGSDYYSAWASFDDANPETSTDFQIDTTVPGITSVSSGTPGTNSVTITWSTSGEISTSRVEYDTAGTFTGGYDCAGTSECTALADTSPRVNAHSVAFSNLSSGTIYHYRVRSKDAAGNESVSSNYSFTTASISQPAKTTKSYIDGAIGVVSAATTYYFTLNLPETTPAVQNAYVELFGVVSGGSGTIALQVNGAPTRTYTVEATSPTLYRFLYRIPSPGTEANLNIEDAAPCTNGNPLGTPPCNKVIITPSTVSMYVLSARIIATYAYTP